MNRLIVLFIAVSSFVGCSSFQLSPSSPPPQAPIGWVCTHKDPASALECSPAPKMSQDPQPHRTPSATDRVQAPPSRVRR